MQTNQERTLQSLRAIQTFIDGHAHAIPSVADSGARRELANVIEQLTYHVSAQSGASLGSRLKTQEQHALRVSLLQDHMAPLVAIARLWPGAFPPGTFRMPKLNSAPARLVKAAQDMAQAATPRAGDFSNMGLHQDFIPQLLAAAQAVHDSVGERTQLLGKRVGSTSTLRATLSSARRLVHVLDALTRKAIMGDTALLTNWNFVRRLDGGVVAATDMTQLPASTSTPLLANNARNLLPQSTEDVQLDPNSEVQVVLPPGEDVCAA